MYRWYSLLFYYSFIPKEAVPNLKKNITFLIHARSYQRQSKTRKVRKKLYPAIFITFFFFSSRNSDSFDPFETYLTFSWKTFCFQNVLAYYNEPFEIHETFLIYFIQICRFCSFSAFLVQILI